MSMKSWKEEFYPVRPSKKMSKLKAIQHSLTKWEGLLQKNLKKHKVRVAIFWDLVDTHENSEESPEYFMIDADSCALCVKYMDEDSMVHLCISCPLYNTLGKCCGAGEPDDPFTRWKDESDPKPMIKALKKCLKENS